MKEKAIYQRLLKVAEMYPESLRLSQKSDCKRIAYNISLPLQFVDKEIESLSIMDIGGGIGMFSVGCKEIGFSRVVLVDDFNDPVNRRVGEGIFSIHEKAGVEVCSRDAVAEGVLDIPGKFDIISTFDSMEHWHHSPKKLFRHVMEKLTPGGVFVLGVPNCVNIRKRLTLPFGFYKWSPMETWYEEETFRGHVREPDVPDLIYIARDMGLESVRVFGANWLGTKSLSWFVRWPAKIMDYFLRLYPGFCSDIYLVGKKGS